MQETSLHLRLFHDLGVAVTAVFASGCGVLFAKLTDAPLDVTVGLAAIGAATAFIELRRPRGSRAIGRPPSQRSSQG